MGFVSVKTPIRRYAATPIGVFTVPLRCRIDNPGKIPKTNAEQILNHPQTKPTQTPNQTQTLNQRHLLYTVYRCADGNRRIGASACLYAQGVSLCARCIGVSVRRTFKGFHPNIVHGSIQTVQKKMLRAQRHSNFQHSSLKFFRWRTYLFGLSENLRPAATNSVHDNSFATNQPPYCVIEKCMPGQHICNDNVSVKANGRNANGYFVIMLQITRWLVLARDTLWFRGQGALYTISIECKSVV